MKGILILNKSIVRLGDFLFSIPLINFWQKRSLVFHFSLMELKMRYKQSYLGLFWAALEPLLMFVILYVVFTSIRESRRDDFAIYLITGIMIYHVFLKGSMGGLSSLRSNQAILKSLNIQREFFPIVSTGSITLLMFVEVAVFLILMPFFGFIPSWTIVLLPIVIILLLFLILGVSYLLSIVYVHFADVQYLWGVFVYALLFASPVFWYLDEIDGVLLEVQKINPIGQLLEIAHKLVFGQEVLLTEWLYTSGFVFGILFLGYYVFKKYEKIIVEKL